MIPVTLAQHLHAKLTGIMERRGGHAGRDAGRGESVGLRGHRGGGGLIQPSLPAAESPAEAGVAARVARERRPLVVAAWATVAVALSFCYLRVAPTQPADSYGAVFTLQACGMVHRNPLLHR